MEKLNIKKLFGTQKELAKAINITQQSVSDWIVGKKKPSAKNAIRIEKATNGAITRAEIRPDLFGEV